MVLGELDQGHEMTSMDLQMPLISESHILTQPAPNFNALCRVPPGAHSERWSSSPRLELGQRVAE